MKNTNEEYKVRVYSRVKGNPNLPKKISMRTKFNGSVHMGNYSYNRKTALETYFPRLDLKNKSEEIGAIKTWDFKHKIKRGKNFYETLENRKGK